MQIKSQQSKIQVKIGQRTYLGQQEDYFISLPLTDVRYRPSGENEGQDTPKPNGLGEFRFRFVSSDFIKGFQMQINPSTHPLEK